MGGQQLFEARIVCRTVEDTRAHDQILLALARARSDHGLNEVLYLKDVFVWTLERSRGNIY